MAERLATDAALARWDAGDLWVNWHEGSTDFETAECVSAPAWIAALIARIRAADALLKRPANDSTVTTSDGPGCFWCDWEEHTPDCPYAAYRKATEPKETT